MMERILLCAYQVFLFVLISGQEENNHVEYHLLRRRKLKKPSKYDVLVLITSNYFFLPFFLRPPLYIM